MAQQVLATMIASEQPPTIPSMLFIEELGHPQIEHEREALYRLRFVQSSTFQRFRESPIELIDEAIASLTPEITRLRVQARYWQDSLDKAINALWVSHASARAGE